MQRNIIIIIIFFLGLIFTAFTKNTFLLLEEPYQFPASDYDFTKNQLTQEKIDLGRVLFYDPILSKDSSISCASCHSPYSAFTHIDHTVSHGINNKMGNRNSPALMNLAWQKSFMWDGAINHLDVQALAPMSNPDEMGSSMDSVVEKLQKSVFYKYLFYNAYGDTVITGQKTLKSIAQFLLTLVSSNSKYDKVICKQDTFTLQELNGYKLFKKNCNSCHKEPLFSSYEFKNNGLKLDTIYKDYGRIKITKNEADSFKFKIPSLRNIEYSYPYMHDGRFKKLSDVLNHYTNGIQKNSTLAFELQQPIVLTANEKVDLIAFLLTLSDKTFVFNPDFSFPKNLFLKKSKN